MWTGKGKKFSDYFCKKKPVIICALACITTNAMHTRWAPYVQCAKYQMRHMCNILAKTDVPYMKYTVCIIA
jgi:hypothetical protein